VVYSLTVRSFRRFLISKISQFLSLSRRCIQRRAPSSQRQGSNGTHADALTQNLPNIQDIPV
jgi:hypothetical protein